MAWMITKEAEFDDQEIAPNSRVGWYFPNVKYPWQLVKDDNPVVPMLIGWKTKDDDGEMMYEGIMDAAAYDNNLEEIYEFSVNDVGATSLWCKVPGEAWECIIG